MSRLAPLDDDLDLLLAPAREIPPVEPDHSADVLDGVRRAVARDAAGRVATVDGAQRGSATASPLRGWRYGAMGLVVGIAIGAVGAIGAMGAFDAVDAVDAVDATRPSTQPSPVANPRPAATGSEVPTTNEHVEPIVEAEPPPPRAVPRVDEERRAAPRPAGPVVEAPIAPPTDSDALVGERRLLDVALAQVDRGQPAAALTTLSRHEAEFPNGQLVQSREVLRIRALHTLGRVAEARERLDAFERRYPSASVLPTLRARVLGD
jgi:hypothetical protein